MFSVSCMLKVFFLIYHYPLHHNSYSSTTPSQIPEVAGFVLLSNWGDASLNSFIIPFTSLIQEFPLPIPFVYTPVSQKQSP